MASGVVSKVDSHHSWSGGKWQKRREKKGGREGGGVVVWILASLVLDYLLGVMVRVAQFVSEGCCGRAQVVSATRLLLFDVGI